MKFNTEASPDPLLRRMQIAINKALGFVGYDFAQRLDLRAYSTEFPKVIAVNLPRPPWGLQLVYLRDTTSDTPPTAGVFVDWIPDPNGIRIRGITGLTAGRSYDLRFIAYA